MRFNFCHGKMGSVDNGDLLIKRRSKLLIPKVEGFTERS